MLTSAKFILSLTCLIWGNMALKALAFSVHQDRGLISANVGENVTLHCSYDAAVEAAWLFWYKQPFGKQPYLVSSFFVFDTEEYFHDDFKNNQRFTLRRENWSYHLTISDAQILDSATYYCASSSTFTVQFPESVTVIVREAGLTVQPSIDQSVLGTVQLGGSVTLCCNVHMENCGGEHSVYWYKNPTEPHPRILYEGRAKKCEKQPNTKAHNCVYHLDLKGLNRSHAGNYYCALVVCGYMLFGNGTVLDFEDEVKSQVVVFFLIGALTLTTILVVLLIGQVYKMNQKNSFQSTDVRSSAPVTLIEDDNRETDDLHYAALSMNTAKRFRTQRNPSTDDCVYSSVRK